MQIISPRFAEWGIALKKIKKRGIQQTIILYLAIFAVFIVLLLWLFQIGLLDLFYKSYKIRQITSTADSLVQNLNQDSNTLSDLASTLAEHNELCIVLLDENQNILLSAEGTRNCLIHRLSSRGLSWWCSKASEDGRPTTEFFHMHPVPVGPFGSLLENPPKNASSKTQNLKREKQEHKETQSHILSMLYAKKVKLSDGTVATLLLNSQINPVNATIVALRSQLLVITFLVSIGVLILAALISRRVSTPIIETNAAARELSHAHYSRPSHADSYAEILELNDTLSKAAFDLGQVEALQHELIANISHDLRTPLTMIGGYAEAMRDLPSENTPENMQIIIDETARLSSLVSELLDFSQMQTGGMHLNLSVFCLTDAIHSTILRVGKLTAKDGYTISFNYREKIHICADETRIAQVIYNLIGNALTYTGNDLHVDVSQSVENGMVKISVSDSGKGIPEDEIDLIWNRYYRTKEIHKRAVIGSGLGLNIVRTILEQHKAKYGVSSKIGQGSTFWFSFPVCQMTHPE